ncbi:MAG: RidA family protein, partial [Ferruginibacter sp.]
TVLYLVVQFYFMRQQVGSGSPWEDIVGYSRAVRVGNIIEVAGTTAMDGDTLVGKGDVYAQTKFIFQKIEQALQQLGSSLNDVVRTRMFVTNISDWELIGKAHGEFFATIKPVATMVGVKALINNDLLIEIEVTAMIP